MTETTFKFTLDVNNLPQMTRQDQDNLEASPIDYSEVPELSQEFFDVAQEPTDKPKEGFEKYQSSKTNTNTFNINL